MFKVEPKVDRERPLGLAEVAEFILRAHQLSEADVKLMSLLEASFDDLPAPVPFIDASRTGKP